MKIKIVSLLLVVLFLASCGDENPTPKVLKNATLLAGKKGESKSWRITSFVIKSGNQTEDIFENVEDCFADNIFTFSNSEDQEFVQKEGSAKCDINDPSTIEKGTWYLTTNGLKVSVIVLDVMNEYSALFTYFPFSWNVSELTSSSLEIEYEDQDGVVFTITFEEA